MAGRRHNRNCEGVRFPGFGASRGAPGDEQSRGGDGSGEEGEDMWGSMSEGGCRYGDLFLFFLCFFYMFLVFEIVFSFLFFLFVFIVFLR